MKREPKQENVSTKRIQLIVSNNILHVLLKAEFTQDDSATTPRSIIFFFLVDIPYLPDVEV